jgi:DNA-binding SARP family transcriptional activator
MTRLFEALTAMLDLFDRVRPRASYLLLHPESRFRSMLVASLLSGRSYPVFYYALSADDIDLRTFLSGIVRAVANQQPLFGRHALIEAADPAADVQSLCLAFSRDLAEIAQQESVLILDEFDRSDTADDIQAFLQCLGDYIPDGMTIVLNGRTVPRQCWAGLIAKRRGMIMMDDRVLIQDFYGPAGSDGSAIDVFALGPGFVLLDNEPIDTWEGHLPRLLFFYALDRPVITRSEICTAFWPDLNPDQAVNVFHVTKRRLHKALKADVLIHENGFYRLNPILNLRYDVFDFVHHLTAARSATPAEQLTHSQLADDLYRGSFLQGHTEPWIVSRQNDFRIGHIEALARLADLRLQSGQPEAALALCGRALQEDDQREDLHREIMRLYANLGRRSEAVSHFRELEARRAAAGLSISAETADVLNSILA